MASSKIEKNPKPGMASSNEAPLSPRSQVRPPASSHFFSIRDLIGRVSPLLSRAPAARTELLRGAPGLRGGRRGIGVPPHRAPRPGPQRRRRGGGAPRRRRQRPPPWGRGRRCRGGRRGQGRGRRVRPDAPGHRRRHRRVHELRPPGRRRSLRAAPREVHGQGNPIPLGISVSSELVILLPAAQFSGIF
jgi:hypothetical protein